MLPFNENQSDISVYSIPLQLESVREYNMLFGLADYPESEEYLPLKNEGCLYAHFPKVLFQYQLYAAAVPVMKRANFSLKMEADFNDFMKVGKKIQLISCFFTFWC